MCRLPRVSPVERLLAETVNDIEWNPIASVSDDLTKGWYRIGYNFLATPFKGLERSFLSGALAKLILLRNIFVEYARSLCEVDLTKREIGL